MADSIVAFITERLDGDGAWARQLAEHGDQDAIVLELLGGHPAEVGSPYALTLSTLRFLKYLGPARVLREIQAKRLMLADHQTGISRHYDCRNRDHIQDWQCERACCSFEESRYCEICPDSDYLGMCRGVRLLAAPYAGHPDYQQEWAP